MIPVSGNGAGEDASDIAGGADLLASGGESEDEARSRTARQSARQAARLLRWYPRSWRDRYGIEFTELLIADIEERPNSPIRTIDVARSGLLARLAAAGLTAFPLSGTPAIATASRTLGTLSCGFAVFVALGAALWSQLLIAMQWSAQLPTGPGPNTVSISPATGNVLSVNGTTIIGGPVPPADAIAANVMSVAMLLLLVLAVIAAVPVAVTVTARFARHRNTGLTRPAITLAGSLAVLFIGGRHFGNGWVGTGGHHAIVPSGLAAFVWAVTLFVSSYWFHPAAFAAFPLAEQAWMALAPIALFAATASAAALVRRCGLSPRSARFEARLGSAACMAMTAFLAGCIAWLLTPGSAVPGQPDLFHAGLIDIAGAAVLALTLAVAAQASRMALRGLRGVARVASRG